MNASSFTEHPLYIANPSRSVLDTGGRMTAIEDDDGGSEDVNDFLKRIKELGDRRDREDEERNRRLEEQIVQGRKERQARREG